MELMHTAVYYLALQIWAFQCCKQMPCSDGESGFNSVSTNPALHHIFQYKAANFTLFFFPLPSLFPSLIEDFE